MTVFFFFFFFVDRRNRRFNQKNENVSYGCSYFSFTFFSSVIFFLTDLTVSTFFWTGSRSWRIKETRSQRETMTRNVQTTGFTVKWVGSGTMVKKHLVERQEVASENVLSPIYQRDQLTNVHVVRLWTRKIFFSRHEIKVTQSCFELVTSRDSKIMYLHFENFVLLRYWVSFRDFKSFKYFIINDC